MLALRYAALLTLVVWVGGLLALGAIAAPSTFDVLAAKQIPDGRLLAGALFGEMLRRFHIVGYVAGALLLATLILRRVLGPRPRRFAWRAGLAALMLGASAYSGVAVSARIARLQQEIGAAPSSLPEGTGASNSGACTACRPPWNSYRWSGGWRSSSEMRTDMNASEHQLLIAIRSAIAASPNANPPAPDGAVAQGAAALHMGRDLFPRERNLVLGPFQGKPSPHAHRARGGTAAPPPPAMSLTT
jgi:hypothetical protein